MFTYGVLTWAPLPLPGVLCPWLCLDPQRTPMFFFVPLSPFFWGSKAEKRNRGPFKVQVGRPFSYRRALIMTCRTITLALMAKTWRNPALLFFVMAENPGSPVFARCHQATFVFLLQVWPKRGDLSFPWAQLWAKPPMSNPTWSIVAASAAAGAMAGAGGAGVRVSSR